MTQTHSTEVVAVAVPGALDRLLDYLAPPEGVAPGALVEVPLGPRRVAGVVWGPGTGDVPVARLRPVARVYDLPPLGEELRRFLARAADYTMTPLPAMLRLALRVPGLGADPPERRLLAPGLPPGRMTPARARVLGVLADHGGAPMPAGDLARAAGVSAGVVTGLVRQGALVELALPRDAPFARLDPARPAAVALSTDQEAAARALRAAVGQGGYGTTLLRGVTGSGKTEVYLEAAAAALALGRQVLVLLPEIALSGAFLARVEARFGARPAEWHSGVGQADRRRTWRMVAEGGAQLVVGARSALFLPFRDLGLIIVDEEHDSSYKQEEGVLYHARDMAVLRGAIAGARVVLASATPSLETWVNAQEGRYARLDLHARVGAAVLPEMRAIDLRAEDMARGSWISHSLAQAVEGALARGEQALLFLNRRGYAPVTVCRACGQQIACHQCDARMVEHRFLRRLVCHHCGESAPVPELCPACGAAERLTAVGPGVERLAEEAAARFPQARQAVLSSDLFTTARALRSRVAEIAEGGADLILGTQLVAKGHNFPLLTLVGVIDADLGLAGSDLRAAERTFQLMRQVSGRAGRAGDRPGLALIQTHQPDHPVIRAILSGAEESFWQAEAEERRRAGAPPFGRFVGLILSGPAVEPLFDLGTALARGAAPLSAIGAEVLGPAAAPIAQIRGRFRVRLLIRAPRGAPVQGAIRSWLGGFRWPAAVRVAIDVDPQSFF